MGLLERLQRHELAIAAIVTIPLSITGIVYVASLPPPVFFSFDELARAAAVCGRDTDLDCMTRSLSEKHKLAPEEVAKALQFQYSVKKMQMPPAPAGPTPLPLDQ